jgi:hypothetical protein
MRIFSGIQACSSSIKLAEVLEDHIQQRCSLKLSCVDMYWNVLLHHRICMYGFTSKQIE